MLFMTFDKLQISIEALVILLSVLRDRFAAETRGEHIARARRDAKWAEAISVRFAGTRETFRPVRSYSAAGRADNSVDAQAF